MKKIMLAVLLLVGLFSINTSALAGLAGNDWEYWSHYEVVGSISEDLDFKVKPELRYDDNFSNHYYTTP
ncbi:MAG: hypothetical protein V1800_13030 [Candidatus Latescibacterota bacterium]